MAETPRAGGEGGVPSDDERNAYNLTRALERGKEAMTRAEFLEAARHFGRAIELCGEKKERAILWANRSVALLKGGKPKESLADAKLSIKEDPNYARGFWRCAAALISMGCNARNEAEAVLKIDPEHAEAKEYLQRLAEPEVSTEKVQRETRNATAYVNAGTAHATMYAYCTYCNNYGHRRGDCPAMVRKRTRE